MLGLLGGIHFLVSVFHGSITGEPDSQFSIRAKNVLCYEVSRGINFESLYPVRKRNSAPLRAKKEMKTTDKSEIEDRSVFFRNAAAIASG